MSLSLIVAAASNLVIGSNNKMPWHIPDDLKHFKNTTVGKTVIMGRNTYDSIGYPLKDRMNIIITSRDLSIEDTDDVIIVDTPEEALHIADVLGEDIMVIGGASLYKHYLPGASYIYYTEVHHAYEGDAFFPELNPREWTEVDRKCHPGSNTQPDISFVIYKRTSTTG